MYRIELSAGEETVFRSIEELAVAIRRGVVTPRARIYHNASQKWLPIQFHPHYKIAASMPLTQAELVTGPPVKPLSTLSLQEPADSDPPLAITPIAVPTPRVATAFEQPVRKKKTRAEQPAGQKRSRRPTKPRRQLRIALVGALLIGGAQWVLSAPLFSRTEAPALLRAQRHLITAPAEAMRRVSSPNTAAMVPVIRTPVAPAAPASLGSVAQPQPIVGGTNSATTTPLLETAAAASEVEPAPSSIDVSAPPAPKAESLAPKMVDSTNRKAIKTILRAVSGTETKEKTPAKR
jgi:hypothetical protein